MRGFRSEGWLRLYAICVVPLVSCAFTHLPGQEPPPYNDIDPRKHMCEIGVHRGALNGDTLWVHGGYVVYSVSSTQHSSHPNTYLRAIDFSKSFTLADRDTAPVTFKTMPPAVPEISQFTLWAHGSILYEFSGTAEVVDPNYPGLNANSRSEMWAYNTKANEWSVGKLYVNEQTEKTFEVGFSPYAVAVKSLGKGYHLGGHPWPGRPGNRLISEFDFATGTWGRFGSEFKEAHFGDFVHVPVGKRGLLVMVAGHKKINNKVEDNYGRIDIYNLNEGNDKVAGRWIVQTATPANPKTGIPRTRETTCSWVVSAPDGSSHHIYMYGGYIPAGRNSVAELWVLSLPSFEWILLDDGSKAPKQPEFTQTDPGRREGHSCHLIRNSVMVMFGGRVGVRNAPNWTEHWKQRRCETTGLYAFDLNTQKWIESYNPQKASEAYRVPEGIYKVIGGDANGGSKKKAVAGWGDKSLETLEWTNAPSNEEGPSGPDGEGGTGSDGLSGIGWDKVTDTTPPDNVAGTDSLTSEGETKDSESSASIGAIAGGVVGGVAALAIVIAGVIFFRRKRRTRKFARQSSTTLGSPLPRYSSGYKHQSSASPVYMADQDPANKYERPASLHEADSGEPPQELSAGSPQGSVKELGDTSPLYPPVKHIPPI